MNPENRKTYLGKTQLPSEEVQNGQQIRKRVENVVTIDDEEVMRRLKRAEITTALDNLDLCTQSIGLDSSPWTPSKEAINDSIRNLLVSSLQMLISRAEHLSKKQIDEINRFLSRIKKGLEVFKDDRFDSVIEELERKLGIQTGE